MDYTDNNFEVSLTNNYLIEMWSLKRLPFEPKGWLVEMRDSLREHLKNLHKVNGAILYAAYQSDQIEYFDVENVLFYNVGSSAFSHLNIDGLVFERQFKKPPKNYSLTDKQYNHYQSYCLTNKMPDSLFWKEKDLLAKWQSVPIPILKVENKPHDIWYKMKNSSIEVIKDDSPLEYGIEININAPISSNVHITSVMKPLLDGIISVFNYHNGYEIDEVSIRLSKVLNEDKVNIKKLLLEKNSTIFGSRNLLQPYRKNFKWNPMDDNLYFVKIVINSNNKDNKWTHSGRLFSLERKETYNETSQTKIIINKDKNLKRHQLMPEEKVDKPINNISYPDIKENKNITEYEAIIEAFNDLGGIRTISEIKNWVTEKYTRHWKDISTTMADMVAVAKGGNKSSTLPDKKRVLERVSRGKYKMIDER